VFLDYDLKGNHIYVSRVGAHNKSSNIHTKDLWGEETSYEIVVHYV